MAGIAAPVLMTSVEGIFTSTENYVADFLAPPIPVKGAISTEGEKKFTARAYKIGDHRSLPNQKDLRLAAGEPAQRIGISMSDYEIEIGVSGLAHEIDRDVFDSVKTYLSTYETTVVAPALATGVLNEREYKFREFVDKAGNVASNNIIVGAADTYWDNDANNPLKQFEEAVNALRLAGGFDPRSMRLRLTIPYAEFNALRGNAKMRAYFGANNDSNLSVDQVLNMLKQTMFPAAPGNVEIRIASAVAADVNEGQLAAAAYDDIMSGRVIMAAVPREGAAGLMDRAWAKGYTLDSSDHNFVRGLRSRRYEEERIDTVSWQLDSAFAPGVFDNRLAFVWKDVITPAS